MDGDTISLIIACVAALIVIVAVLLNRGRIKTLLFKVPGVSAKVENHEPEVGIEKSTLDKSPIVGLEGSQISVTGSDLRESGITIQEKGRRGGATGEKASDEN